MTLAECLSVRLCTRSGPGTLRLDLNRECLCDCAVMKTGDKLCLMPCPPLLKKKVCVRIVPLRLSKGLEEIDG